MESVLLGLGAFSFGAVIGWCASLAIRSGPAFGLSQLSALIGAVGGAAVSAHFEQVLFSAYCVGLALFFFSHRFLGYRPIREFIEREFSKETDEPVQLPRLCEKCGKESELMGVNIARLSESRTKI